MPWHLWSPECADLRSLVVILTWPVLSCNTFPTLQILNFWGNASLGCLFCAPSSAHVKTKTIDSDYRSRQIIPISDNVNFVFEQDQVTNRPRPHYVEALLTIYKFTTLPTIISHNSSHRTDRVSSVQFGASASDMNSPTATSV